MSELSSIVEAFQQNLRVGEPETCTIDEKTSMLFNAMLSVEDIYMAAILEASSGEVVLSLEKGESFGWPAFNVFARRSGVEIGVLSILAEDRREAPILKFSHSFSTETQELSWRQYSRQELLYAATRDSLRDFLSKIIQAIQLEKNNKKQNLFSNLDDLDPTLIGGNIDVNESETPFDDSTSKSSSELLPQSLDNKSDVESTEDDDLIEMDVFS